MSSPGTSETPALSSLVAAAPPSTVPARMSQLVLALLVRAIGLSTGIAALATAAVMLF